MQLALKLADRCIHLVQDLWRVVIAACIALDSIGGVAIEVRVARPDQRGGDDPVNLTRSIDGRVSGIQITVQNDDEYRGVASVSASE
jgi:hypothetical protein